ncbi:packaged DNA stabilization protein gp10 [Salipiger thiooxidans]|uniref:packaged DNA stabilization protein gp10 n=1 Tax=Salipiger thiooxidans TaxID=282683 RepID=UPI001CD43180|nr:packaged DNA stabilization protein gp10 [Salipiger thiooxidans]MCA0846117.1 packaged DNA stabilization protein gp10 [Salipiger thiooxidans]
MLSILARQSKPGSYAYSGERLVNCFLRPSDGATSGVLLCRGGLTKHVDLGTGGPVRALAKLGGSIYAVSVGTVWKVTGAAVVSVGSVSDGETYIAVNRSQIAIVVGGKYYVCDGSATSEVSTGAVDTPVGVVEADGYMIVFGTGAGLGDLVQVSALDDASTFEADQFAAAEYKADSLVGAIVDHGQLHLFGEETVETFYNSGDVDFPFAPNRAAVIEHGCINGKTIEKADSAVYWVAPDGKVLRNFGGSPEVISTPEIKDALAKSTVTGGFTFSERGHEFYAVTRADGTTFVFDMVTRLWHERVKGLLYGPWAAICRVNLDGTQYFGCDNGVIATMSETVYQDFGNYLQLEFETPLQVNGGELFRVSRIHIDVDSGTGGLGRTPKCMLQVSTDGVNWGRERWRDLADLGQYGKRAAWHGLGQFRRGKIRFRVTDPVKRDVIGGAVRYG